MAVKEVKEIIKQALAIRDAVNEGEIKATHVGGTFEDIIDTFEETKADKIEIETVNNNISKIANDLTKTTFLYDVSIANSMNGQKAVYKGFEQAFKAVPEGMNVSQIKFIDESTGKYVFYQLEGISGNWQEYRVYTPDENNEYLFSISDSNGLIVWGIKSDGKVYSKFGIKEGFREFFNEDGFIYAIGNEQGQIFWGVKEDGSVFPEINDVYEYLELNEFIYTIVDNSGKLVFGIKKDGTPHFPERELLENQTSNEFLYVKTDTNNNILFGIYKDGTPYLPGKELLDKDTNHEFIYHISDSSGKVLFGIRTDGSFFIPDKELPDLEFNSEYINLIKDAEGKIIFGIRKDGTINTPLNPLPIISESNEFVYAITDSQGYVIYGIRKDGTIYNPSESNGAPINNDYYTESEAIQVAIPTSVARVDIDVNLGLLTTSKNAVNCTLEYRDNTGVYFSKPATIAYQGSSSMAFIKKNFSIDLFNDESRTENFKIKFGDWVPQDSFHLKAYYIDSMLARDPVCNRLWHQIIESRPYDNRYPYQVPYTYGWKGQQIPDSDQTVDQRFMSSGARCHVDGFPIEIYIRGEYWGLYVWRLKKHRDNYRMDKSNQNNILMELSGRTYMQLYKTIIYPSVEAMNTVTPDNDEGCFVDISDGTYDLYYSPYSTETHVWRKLGTKTAAQMEVIHTDEALPYTMEVKWERWEVRNPKIDAIWQKGDEFEPVECKAKRSIYSFLEWCNKYTASTITREEIETHLNVSFCIDFYLFCEFVHAWDLRVKNALYGTYDGVIWQPYPYDLDCVFGSSASGKFRGDNPNTVTTNTQIPIQFVQARYGDEFKSRYAELKNSGIFNVENVISLFMDFTNMIGTDLYQKNFNRWPMIPSEQEDAYFSISQIGAWIKDRITYMDKKYLN